MAIGLGISENFVRVSKRQAAIKLGVEEAPKSAATPADKKSKAADAKWERKIANLPFWKMSLDEQHALCLALKNELDAMCVEGLDVADLKRMGRDDLVQRKLAMEREATERREQGGEP